MMNRGENGLKRGENIRKKKIPKKTESDQKDSEISIINFTKISIAGKEKNQMFSFTVTQI